MTGPTTAKHTVLIIEDEPDVIDLLRLNLAKAGFRVLEARDGLSGLAVAREKRPDAIILDLMLPEMRGEEVCRQLKSRGSTAAIPVIMLTAKAQASERVAGLELGADDYVAKPFSPREMVLRIQGILRRLETSASDRLAVGPFEIDRGSFEVRLDGAKLDLTVIEFKLLVMLMEKRGRVLSREDLLRDVWGYHRLSNSRTVDTHMRRLRTKLGDHAARLETVRSHGYRFRAGQED
ncbi:MAG: response regulator [Chthoniobacterales bacterium]|nr:response regulator [Chthoniobacterales bacterium]